MDQNKFLTQRTMNYWLLGLSYATLYFSRYNLSSTHKELANFLHWSYSNYGVIIGFALLVYGLTVFFAGPICDKIGGKKALLIGMFGSIICNVVFGATFFLVKDGYTNPSLYYGLNLSDLLRIMIFIWSTNYFFQSFGALSVVKVNSAWYTKEERGKFAGKFGMLIQVGRILVLVACPWILYVLPWPFVFFIPAASTLIMMFLVWHLIEDKPESLGISYGSETKHLSIKDSIKTIIESPYIYLIVGSLFVAFFNGMIRNGLEHYIARFFTDQFNVGARQLNTFFPYIIYSILTPGLMMLASGISGFSSDKYFGSRRFPIIVGSFLLVIIGLFCLMLDMKNAYFSCAFLVFTMFALQAVNNILMGTLTVDLAGKNVSGTVTGLFDGIQYFGGSFSCFVIGIILRQTKEWHNWPAFLLIAALLGLAASVKLAKKEKNGN